MRTVKEKELPELDDDFAQLASEFDTLDELRDDLRERLTRVQAASSSSTPPGTRPSRQLVEAAEVPAPEGVVRDEVESRKQAMIDQLERIGASLEDYLAAEDKTEEQIDAELNEAATEGVKIQLLLDTLADAEDVQVSDDEFGHEIVHRAQRAGMAPQQYYDQLVRSGAAGRGLRRRAAGQGARLGDGADQDQGLGGQRGQPRRDPRRRRRGPRPRPRALIIG